MALGRADTGVRSLIADHLAVIEVALEYLTRVFGFGPGELMRDAEGAVVHGEGQAGEQGATIRYGPVDQPYGYREYSAVDLEGHLWSFMKPIT